MIDKDKKKLINSMIQAWPSGVVARTKMKDFTGGLLSGRTMANIESRANVSGIGLEDLPRRISHKGKAAYVTSELAQWFVNRKLV